MAMGLMPTSAQPQMGGSAAGQSGGAHYAVPRQSAPMRY
jgi:hypothetical protein